MYQLEKSVKVDLHIADLDHYLITNFDIDFIMTNFSLLQVTLLTSTSQKANINSYVENGLLQLLKYSFVRDQFVNLNKKKNANFTKNPIAKI